MTPLGVFDFYRIYCIIWLLFNIKDGFMEEFDAIVVGGGIVGRSTAWYLGKSGKHTLLLEQHDLEIPRGSSKGYSRVYGEAFADDIRYHLARQSRYFWQDLESEIGDKLLYLNSGVDISTKDISGVVAKLESRGTSFEFLDGDSLRRRYPQWHCDSSVNAIYSPYTGFLEAESCMKAVLLSARKNKVTVRGGSQVIKIEPGNKTILVKTLYETYRTQKIVITAGPWAFDILAQFGVILPLKVSQEQIVYFEPIRNAELFRPENFPTWEWDGADFIYGIPIFERNGIKIAFHRDKHYLKNVEDFSLMPSVGVIERLRLFLDQHLPDAAGEAFEAMTCMYTNTPDLGLVIDTIPGFPQIVYFTGCNGNSFHRAPALGRIITELLYEGKASIDISCFSAKRFN
jgi:sarcosine oxidase